MRQLFLLCFCLSLFTCDDGDIITVELDFEDTFQQCGNLLFYKTKTDPSESLSLTLPTLTLENLIDLGENTTLETVVNLSGTNVFNYRTYDINLPSDYFCNDVPPSGINILSDAESNTGTVTITTELVEDDEDGIPAILEDLNGDGDFENDDTDGDGLPNYIDADDDGDNVLTATEIPDPDGDNDISDAQDTDMDGIPDYLDNDDDGDGVLTRDEENDTQDQNPTDDKTDPENPNLEDYLNPNIQSTVPATAYRPHTIIQTFEIRCIVSGIQLPTLTQETFDFGELANANTPKDTRTITPEFN